MGLRPGQKTAATFKKGVSGNPGGRRKDPLGLAEHKRDGPVIMLAFLRSVVEDTVEVPPQKKGDPPGRKPVWDIGPRINAAVKYLEYTLPKPVSESAELQDSVRLLVEAIRAKEPVAPDDETEHEP